MPTQFSIQDKQASFRLSGRFTYEEHEEFHHALESLKNEDLTSATVYLTNVEFIDSAGLGMLLLLRDKLPTQVGITLIGAQNQVRQILQLTKLDTVFNLQ